MRPRKTPWPTLCAALLGVSLLALPARAASGERFTVCSITVNSDDEIRAFKRALPASRFDFVELA
ncbi:MAG: hypothetical protein ACREQQ_18710, partial [Candidatus Binatia bacterium]